MIQLITCDIDGTLLDSQSRLPLDNIHALRAATAHGIQTILATIRKRDSAEAIACQLGIPCGLVCQGGATIYDQDGAKLREVTIPLELAHSIAALADEQCIPLLTTIDEVNYYALCPSHGGVPEGFRMNSNRAILTKPPTRFIVHGEVGVNLVLQAFSDAPLRIVRHYRHDGSLYDAAVTHIDATKELACASLYRRWHIPSANVLALGDAESDIGMLRDAGIGIAVGNAQPVVKAIAGWIAPSADEAGVAVAIRRFVLAERTFNQSPSDV